MPPTLQISVPETSTGTEGTKSYTIYHITLNLPLRLHTIQKRYSDFLTLHSTLTSETGQTPPAPLPAKTWLRSSTSEATISARRAQLESYLRSILDSPDPRWRQSSAWRSFLSLPSALTAPASSPAATLDPSSWLTAHRDAKTHLHTARLALRKRDAAQTASDQHASAAEAKASLVRAATGIAALDGALAGGDTGLGEREVRRRRDMLAALRAETEGVETQLRNAPPSVMSQAEVAPKQGDKEALLAGRRQGRVLGGPAKETERTRELDNSGVLQLQQDVMREQDEDVLVLGQAVNRMKEMGIRINEELVVQNKMLDMLDQDVDRVQGKIEVGKKRIAKIH